MEVVARMAKGESSTGFSFQGSPHRNPNDALPLVVSLNCIEDCDLEQESLAGVAIFEHVSLSQLSDSRIEAAVAVVLQSLAYLPRAAQRRLRSWQLLLCVGSSDRAVDSALASELGLRLVHVDISRAEEIADTVMALFLGLLRRTHLLSRHSVSTSSWLGSVQPLCRGMRRCRGLVLGIVGRSTSARLLAIRSLAFKMSVLYFDIDVVCKKPKKKSSIAFPSEARKTETLHHLLSSSDLISVHCALTGETSRIMNAESLHHVKPGAFLVNFGSSQLVDDCALKNLLMDGTLAGCALDGTDSPQWMEAWVSDLPNVVILPKGTDYSDEAWLDIREKAVSVLRSFLTGGPVPSDAVSEDEDDDNATPAAGSPVLTEGCVVALRRKDGDGEGMHVSRRRVKGGGWFLDAMPDVTPKDPSAQFMVVCRGDGDGVSVFGLRSFGAGGKLLQINRRMEFVFASHTFDVWESWKFEGPSLKECRLVNCKNPSAFLEVGVEILAEADADGVVRSLVQ